MAKCPICNSRKGRRKCLIEDALICSLCCGNTRNLEACSGCVFYQAPKRKYNEVPAYSVYDMEEDMELEAYGNSIESSICAYDVKIGRKLTDSDAIGIIEILIDIYHFQDLQTTEQNPIIAEGLNFVQGAIREDFDGVSSETIVKVLGVIRFVAKRRTNRGREYMNIIHQYVGARVASGLRAVPR